MDIAKQAEAKQAEVKQAEIEQAEIEQAELRKAIDDYTQMRPRYQKLADFVHNQVRQYCGFDLIESCQSRAKEGTSFEKKIKKLNDDGQRKYPDPLSGDPKSGLTDLAGVRAMVFLRNSVDTVCQKIESIFNVFEVVDVGERVYQSGKFGYQSKHMLVKLKEDRRQNPETADIMDLVCEIQVRTLMQHAWAEIEHKAQYKEESPLPLEIKKRFSALAGAMELADRELQNIDVEVKKISQKLTTEIFDEVTSEKLNETTSDNSSPGIYGSIRKLMDERRYGDAVRAYTTKIELEPESYTLLLGRAKARFMMGDTDEAMKDLATAEHKSSSNPQTKRLRHIFTSGYASEIISKKDGDLPDEKIRSGSIEAQ
jgi:ppGpp synthetase/RelA/SpoT-type nucleotidyltranferase